MEAPLRAGLELHQDVVNLKFGDAREDRVEVVISSVDANPLAGLQRHVSRREAYKILVEMARRNVDNHVVGVGVVDVRLGHRCEVRGGGRAVLRGKRRRER